MNRKEEEDLYTKLAKEKLDFKNKIPQGMEPFFKKAETFYLLGKREYRFKNYTRALEAFKKSLSFYPRHGQSRYFAKISIDMIKKQCEKSIKHGKQLITQYKYEQAIKNFTEVMELLEYKKDKSKLYKEAVQMRKIAEKRLQET